MRLLRPLTDRDFALLIVGTLYIALNYALSRLAAHVERRLSRRGGSGTPLTVVDTGLAAGHGLVAGGGLAAN